MMDGRDCEIMGIISADKSINENSGRLEIQYHKTKIGELVLGSYDSKLCLLDFRYRKMRFAVDNRLKKTLNAKFVFQDNKILKETREQITEYLMAERKTFDLPILSVCRDVQKQVWDALLKINQGETSSYLDIAKYIGNEKAVRAVASANGANAIAVIIPCHRIIGSDGELVGYGGGLPIKKRLLNLEEKHSKLANHL